jgi:hypothetical protein
MMESLPKDNISDIRRQKLYFSCLLTNDFHHIDIVDYSLDRHRFGFRLITTYNQALGLFSICFARYVRTFISNPTSNALEERKCNKVFGIPF